MDYYRRPISKLGITFKEVEFESDDWNLWVGKVKVTNAAEEAAIRRLTINLYGPHSLCTEYRNFEHKSIITILIVTSHCFHCVTFLLDRWLLGLRIFE